MTDQQSVDAISESTLWQLRGALRAYKHILFDLNRSLLAPQANVFRMINKVGSETMHTQFLCSLLSPDGDHGLGMLPLKAFLKRLKAPQLFGVGEKHSWPVSEEESVNFGRLPEGDAIDEYDWSVLSEKRTDSEISDKSIQFDLVIFGRKRDVELDSSDSSGERENFCIVVENKISAVDAPDQLKSYYARLAGGAFTKAGNRWLVFLANKDPVNIADNDMTTCYARLAYQSSDNTLLDGIQGIIKELRGPIPPQSRLRHILDQYLEVVQEVCDEDPNQVEPKAVNCLAKHILEDPSIRKFWLAGRKSGNHLSDVLKKTHDALFSAKVGYAVRKSLCERFSERISERGGSESQPENVLEGFMAGLWSLVKKVDLTSPGSAGANRWTLTISLHPYVYSEQNAWYRVYTYLHRDDEIVNPWKLGDEKRNAFYDAMPKNCIRCSGLKNENLEKTSYRASRYLYAWGVETNDILPKLFDHFASKTPADSTERTMDTVYDELVGVRDAVYHALAGDEHKREDLVRLCCKYFRA